jgi:hypothetical protein
MVQVVSSEVLHLSDRVTGHVTYKTTMTRHGIWALTVGIVDPGWQGPIATTLLNFSRVDHAIAEGDAFLRVSFFEHEAVPAEKLRKAPPLEAYLRDIQKIAATMFPPTFLDTKDISEKASRSVLNRLRKEALAWVVLVAVVFTGLQIVAAWFTGSGRPTMSEIESLKDKVEAMQSKLLKSEIPNASGPSSAAPARFDLGQTAPSAPGPAAAPSSSTSPGSPPAASPSPPAGTDIGKAPDGSQGPPK